jgi:uncharacterized protein (TIGR02594 family)
MSKFFRATTTFNIRSGPGVDFEDLGDLPQGQPVEEIGEGWCPVLLDDEVTVGWLSRKYLVEIAQEDIEPDATPTATPAGGSDPIWIKWARSKLGQKEVPGPGDNPEIASWYHLTTLPKSMWHDATAWCAVFVNAAFMLNNIASLRSARAFDYRSFGKAVTTPQKGDVVVFSFSHVAFFLRDLGNGRIECIGGNQSDAVTITSYDKDDVDCYRRAA